MILLLSGCGALPGGASPGGTATAPAVGATQQPTPRPGQEGRVAKAGDKVSVHYTGTLDDGKQFDSSKGKAPLQFTIGKGDVIVGFDRGATGLKVGESKKVRMEAKDAYGTRDEKLVVTVPSSPETQNLTVGQRVAIGQRPAVVTKIGPEGITVDANHELADKALNFEITLVSIDN